MAISPLPLLLLAVLSAAVPLASAAGNAALRGVANDLLPEYGLPKGLIPDSIAAYTFDNATGDFEITLDSTCYVWFGSHYVFYEKTLRGCITYGAISDLSGIQAQKFFVWVYLSGIVAHPEKNTLEFRAGFITEELPVSQFEEVPVCSAGVGAQLRGAAAAIREIYHLPVAQVYMASNMSCFFK